MWASAQIEHSGAVPAAACRRGGPWWSQSWLACMSQTAPGTCCLLALCQAEDYKTVLAGACASALHVLQEQNSHGALVQSQQAIDRQCNASTAQLSCIYGHDQTACCEREATCMMSRRCSAVSSCTGWDPSGGALLLLERSNAPLLRVPCTTRALGSHAISLASMHASPRTLTPTREPGWCT